MNRSLVELRLSCAALCLFVVATAVCGAEPLEVVVESLRFDCSRCPEAYDRYVRSLQAPERDPAAHKAALQALEKSAVTHVQFHHVQRMEPEQRVRQTTRMQDATLELDLRVRPVDQKSYIVELDVTLTQRREAAEAADGGRATQRWATTVTCAAGGSVSVGGGASRTETPGSVPRIEVSVLRVGVKKIEPSNPTAAAASAGRQSIATGRSARAPRAVAMLPQSRASQSALASMVHNCARHPMSDAIRTGSRDPHRRQASDA
jgi:hypothetical protein